MTISRRALVAAGLAGVPMLTAARLWAENEKNGQDTSIDAALAAMLMSDGYKQIEISRYALERSRLDGVRAFAQAEINEHETLKSRLTGMGFQPIATATKSVNRTGTEKPTLMAALRLKQELAEECVTTTEQEFNRKQGLMLDKGYVGQQLYAHYGLLESALVFKRHCTPGFKVVLDDAQSIIERHIATLKTLMAQLDGVNVPTSRPTGADTVPPGTTVPNGTVTPGTTVPPGTTAPPAAATPGIGGTSGEGGRPAAPGAPRGERR